MTPFGRTALLNLMLQKIISNNNATTAQYLRDMTTEEIASYVNLVDDMNVNGGYLGISNTGYTPIGSLKQASPQNYFLRDDGTWQPIPTSSVSNNNYAIVSNTIDFTGMAGDIILNITSGNTLNKVINFSNINSVILRPNTGIQLTINDGLTTGILGIKIAAPTLTVFGTASGFIKLEQRKNTAGAQLFQTEYIDQYNN